MKKIWFRRALDTAASPDPRVQDGADQRLAQMAQDATQRQAEQNKQMADLQQHVAEGTKKLVDADAQARQELLQLQRELRTDQADVGRQRDALESERRAIAKERYWDSILGTSIYAGAGTPGVSAAAAGVLLAAPCHARQTGHRRSLGRAVGGGAGHRSSVAAAAATARPTAGTSAVATAHVSTGQ